MGKFPFVKSVSNCKIQKSDWPKKRSVGMIFAGRGFRYGCTTTGSLGPMRLSSSLLMLPDWAATSGANRGLSA